MHNPDHRIFQLLLARQEAAHAYQRVVNLYLMGGSKRTTEAFDNPDAAITLDAVVECDDFADFTAVQVCDALDRLEEEGKIIVDESVKPTIIKLKPMGGEKCTKH